MADNGSEALSANKKKTSRLSKRGNTAKKVVRNDNGDSDTQEKAIQGQVTSATLGDKMKVKRNPNWSIRETRALISHVITNYDVLFGNHSGSDRTESEKDRVWRAVVVAVNS